MKIDNTKSNSTFTQPTQKTQTKEPKTTLIKQSTDSLPKTQAINTSAIKDSNTNIGKLQTLQSVLDSIEPKLQALQKIEDETQREQKAKELQEEVKKIVKETTFGDEKVFAKLKEEVLMRIGQQCSRKTVAALQIDDVYRRTFLSFADSLAQHLGYSRSWLLQNAKNHNLELNLDRKNESLFKFNKRIELTKNEYTILYYLCINRGRIVSRDEIMDYLWESEEFIDDNTLSVNIKRLRGKLEELGLVDRIQTRRGQGYILVCK